MCGERLLQWLTSTLRQWLFAGIALIVPDIGVINAQTPSQVAAPASINLPIPVDMVRLSPDNTTAFLLSEQDREYLLLDITSGGVIASGQLDIFPTDAAIDAKGSFGYAVGKYTRDSGSVGLARLSLKQNSMTTVAVTPNRILPVVDVDVNDRVFIAGPPSSSVTIVNWEGPKEEVRQRQLALWDAAFGDVGVVKNGGLLFGVDEYGNAIVVVDTHTGRIHSKFWLDYGVGEKGLAGPGSMQIIDDASGLLRKKTTLMYGRAANNSLVIFDLNQRFLGLDIVQSIEVASTNRRGSSDAFAFGRKRPALLLASDADQKAILVGSRGGSRILMFERVVGSVQQRWQADVEPGLIDVSVSRDGRLAVVLAKSGRVLKVIRDLGLGGTLLASVTASEELQVAQATLSAQGYAVGAADGIDGPRTRDAVRLFQRQAGLPETGGVDGRTFVAILDEEIRRTREVPYQRTEGTLPVDWIGAQLRLGNALGTLGERQANPTLLEQSLAAYRAALEEAKRVELPAVVLGGMQNNVCFREAQLGAERSDRPLLEKAVADCKSALEMHDPKGPPGDLAPAYHSVGFALAKLGELTANASDLEEAIQAFRQAVEMFGAAGADTDIAMAKRDLAQTEAGLELIRGVTPESKVKVKQ